MLSYSAVFFVKTNVFNHFAFLSYSFSFFLHFNQLTSFSQFSEKCLKSQPYLIWDEINFCRLYFKVITKFDICKFLISCEKLKSILFGTEIKAPPFFCFDDNSQTEIILNLSIFIRKQQSLYKLFCQ